MKARWCDARREASRLGTFQLHLQVWGAPGTVDVPACLTHHTHFVSEQDFRELWPKLRLTHRDAAFTFTSLAELTFAKLHPELSAHNLYVLEQDVAWTGSLVQIVEHLERELPEADFLCTHPVMVHDGHWGTEHQSSEPRWWLVEQDQWGAKGKHSGWASDMQLRHRCWVFFARYSAPLILQLTDMVSRGEFAHVEWFASTVCTVVMRHCVVEDVVASDAIGTGWGISGLHVTRDPGAWAALPASKNQLWHPVKV